MIRKPIPPRVAKVKKQISQRELFELLKQRNPIKPSSFEQIEAQELEILPPTFTEKHLQTKKVEGEKEMYIGRHTQKLQD